jgi:hypothetical protein
MKRKVEAAHALGGKRNGFDDLRIAGAAADVAGDRLDNFLARRGGISDQQRMRGEDHGRGTVAALHAMRFAEGILQGRKLPWPRRDAFDRGDGIAVRLHRKHQARSHRRAVKKNGACAAYAMLAPGVRAGQQQAFA